MIILIVYGSNSSGTLMASETLATTLQAAGHAVTIKQATDAKPADFLRYDLVILGSCTWEKITATEHLEGQLQEHMEKFIASATGQKFEEKKFAVFGLGDSSYEKFCAAADHLEKFVAEVGGTLIMPSLRIDGYYFDRDSNDAAVKAWGESIAKAII